MAKANTEAARQRAEEKLGRYNASAGSPVGEKALAQRAEAAKMARLRELRLAKEAADRLNAKPTPKRPARG